VLDFPSTTALSSSRLHHQSYAVCVEVKREELLYILLYMLNIEAPYCHYVACYMQGYPPAQQPVTYTFEELPMMQQPQRFQLVSTLFYLKFSTTVILSCFVNLISSQ